MNMGQNAIESFRQEPFPDERWLTLIQESKLKCEMKSCFLHIIWLKNQLKYCWTLFMWKRINVTVYKKVFKLL